MTIEGLEGSPDERPVGKWAGILPILLGLFLSALPLIALGVAAALSISRGGQTASICLGLPLAWVFVYLLMAAIRSPRYVVVLLVSVPAILCLASYLVAYVLTAVGYSGPIFGA